MRGATFKLALKVLMRRKVFTAISLFCIVCTLVVLIVIAALLDQVLAPAAPEVHADRTLLCPHMVMRGESNRSSGEPGYLFLDRYVRPLPGAQSVTVFSQAASVVTYLGERKIVSLLRHTDGEYWRTLQFTFLEGGPFTAADDDAGRAVAVINETTRRRLFGDGAKAVGQDVELDGMEYRVIGVVTDVPRFRETAYADAWAPIGSIRSETYRGNLMGGFETIVLAPDKASIPALKASFAAMLPKVEMKDPRRYNRIEGALRTPLETFVREVNPFGGARQETGVATFVLILVIFALAFMSLPAMNLVNINVSRILERSAEIGVRKAFGASGRNLVAQLVFENIVLCLLGGLIAVFMAWILLRGIEATGMIPYAQLGINWRVFVTALGLAAFFGVLSGIYPAWRMSRIHPVEALRGGGR